MVQLAIRRESVSQYVCGVEQTWLWACFRRSRCSRVRFESESPPTGSTIFFCFFGDRTNTRQRTCPHARLRLLLARSLSHVCANSRTLFQAYCLLLNPNPNCAVPASAALLVPSGRRCKRRCWRDWRRCCTTTKTCNRCHCESRLPR